MADELLRRNLDGALDPGPDFPPPWLLSRTMAAIPAGEVQRSRRRWEFNLRLSPAAQRALAVLLVLAVATAAAGAFLALHNAIPAAPKGTIDIGSDEPTSGSDIFGVGGQSGVSLGLSERDGAAFAISQVGSVRGFQLKLVTYDDAVNGAQDPQRGAENIPLMLQDSSLVGLIGPFADNVAKVEIQLTNQAGLGMISSANADDCFTLSLPGCLDLDGFTPASLRSVPVNNYFRIAASFTFQAIASAEFAYRSLGLRKIGVWDDGLAYSAPLADSFTGEFTRLGGTVVARASFDTSHGTPNFRPWLRAAKAAGAQGIYAGAVSVTYACVARGQSAGIFAPDSDYFGLSGTGSFARGEGIANDSCIRDAGTMANSHMYSTLGVPDAGLRPDSSQVIAAYMASHPTADTGDYTFTAYDAARILINAIGRAIDANGGARPTRRQVLAQLARTTNFHGVTGDYTFDSNGDPTQPVVAILQNQQGSWNAVENVVVSDCTTC